MNVTPGRQAFVPALGRSRLTSLYDPVVRFTTRERTFKRRLLEAAGLDRAANVLDVACGTGTFAIWAKEARPGVHVVGLDADAKVLGMAQRKAKAAGAEPRFVRAMSNDVPFDDCSFDRVVSSLFFHHLTLENKRRTIREAFRVLAPGGELHVADWGKAANPVMRGLFVSVQLLDGFETTRDNVRGVLPELFDEAGFTGVSQPAQFATMYGTLACYRAGKKAARR